MNISPGLMVLVSFCIHVTTPSYVLAVSGNEDILSATTSDCSLFSGPGQMPDIGPCNIGCGEDTTVYPSSSISGTTSTTLHPGMFSIYQVITFFHFLFQAVQISTQPPVLFLTITKLLMGLSTQILLSNAR